MNVLLSTIKRFFRLDISGESSQYDPEPGKVTTAPLDVSNLDVSNLDGTDLSGANLLGADLTGANLGWADLYGPGTIAMTAANLDDIIGADFTGALNVPVRYR